MNCPNCGSALRRILYENVPVLRCLKCHGYLLAEGRLERIKRSPATDVEQLKREVIAEAAPDTKDPIRCPRCRRKMDKRFIEEPAALNIDVCRECRHVWLDGGELGRIELSREMTAQAQEARRFYKRQKEMTAEERAAFEKDLEALPKEKAPPPLIWSMLFGPRRRLFW